MEYGSGVVTIADKEVIILHTGDTIEYFTERGVVSVNTLSATDDQYAAVLLWILEI